MKRIIFILFLFSFTIFCNDNPLLEDEKNTIDIFEKTSNSVVYIKNKGLKRDYFSRNVFEIPQGSGSGFIWDDTGHIVTNFHVIEGAKILTVTLFDNSVYEAEVVGVDPNKDLAVLKINAPQNKLKPIEAGNFNTLKVGRKVLAIGNPFGLDFTLTTGIISAMGREIKSTTGRTIHNVIQTDASINPGNSGGPLINSAGKLIGVNTAIISPSGSSAGIGFAIPINTVLQIVPQLIKFGKVIRPGLGVIVLDDTYSKRLGIEGVVIREVERGSAADIGGLQGLRRNILGQVILGDVIIGIEGEAVTNGDELSDQLEKYRVGDIVSVIILRDDQHYRIKIKLQAVN
ncbi:MAG: 2-alkenal reductase [Candidatus Cloacimonadota bacterium]|nr:MAG: 2-alkenal reductase [Candidatus Cloacimonadota bacterium]PIE78532.1 MAG: 2-alkenal reductase [Candidatus Delongbacteria bacterium]